MNKYLLLVALVAVSALDALPSRDDLKKLLFQHVQSGEMGAASSILKQFEEFGSEAEQLTVAECDQLLVCLPGKFGKVVWYCGGAFGIGMLGAMLGYIIVKSNALNIILKGRFDDNRSATIASFAGCISLSSTSLYERFVNQYPLATKHHEDVLRKIQMAKIAAQARKENRKI